MTLEYAQYKIQSLCVTKSQGNDRQMSSFSQQFPIVPTGATGL